MSIEIPYESSSKVFSMDYMIKNATSIECHDKYTVPCSLCNNQVRKLTRYYDKMICEECENKFIKRDDENE